MVFRFKLVLYIYSLCLSYSFLFADDNDTKIRDIYTFWIGEKEELSLLEIASYCAPVFWFSPDEPLLENKHGREINIPNPFPFEGKSEQPVVYYQLRDILTMPDIIAPAFNRHEEVGKSLINLDRIAAFHIDYIHYYPEESGTGSHKHDTEMAQIKVFVKRVKTKTGDRVYKLIFLQATGTAHAVKWYDNIYTADTLDTNWELELPFHIFVEEGKHASCTDVNGDGYYTPGYDVNVRTMDAWGIKDVVRTGRVFASDFRGWMAKFRLPEHQILPPLPLDSPLRKKYLTNGVYAATNAVYELRPVPDLELAAEDKILQNDMSSYVLDEWPIIREDTDAARFIEWWETDQLIKSISVAFRANREIGLSVSFPLLFTKNIEAPFIGGWLVNRIYLQGNQLRDFGYGILYTPSASRFMDPYVSFGVELDNYNEPLTNIVKNRTDFVLETGIKIRSTIKPTFLSFLSPITDFWGVRLGVKNRGFMRIEELTYVFEIGAGVW